ncbi:hypothetical protein [uncultured Nostoc sp.]
MKYTIERTFASCWRFTCLLRSALPLPLGQSLANYVVVRGVQAALDSRLI